MSSDKTVTVQTSTDPFVAGMIDVRSPEVVGIEYDPIRKTLWVNVDGVCRFRACNVHQLIAAGFEHIWNAQHISEAKKPLPEDGRIAAEQNNRD
jgi:hypothetical protein